MMFLGVHYTSLDFDGVGAEGYTLTIKKFSMLEIDGTDGYKNIKKLSNRKF